VERVISLLALLTVGLISDRISPFAKKIIGLDTSQGMVDVYNHKAATKESRRNMHAICMDILSASEEEIPAEVKEVDFVITSMAYHHIDNLPHVTKVLASLLTTGGDLLIIDLFKSAHIEKISLISDAVSNTFHGLNHEEHHGHEEPHGHDEHHAHHAHHAHAEHHEHAEHHGHAEHHTEQTLEDEGGHRWTEHEIKELLPHPGGFDAETLEGLLNGTGLLKDVTSRRAFSAEKNGTEYTFILAYGRRK
jgi:SAM-dependent methyltransferase